MKSLFTLLVLAIGIGAVYPLVMEQSDSYCSALNNRYRFLAATWSTRTVGASGALPRIYQAETTAASSWLADFVIRGNLSRLPGPVACDLAYWHSVVFPASPLPIRTSQL